MSNIGDNIKRYREAKRMTQSDLAKLLEVTDKAVSSWELGTREPRMVYVEAMAKFFNITKTQLWGWDEEILTASQSDRLSVFSALSPAAQEQALQYMRFLAAQEDKK